MEVHSKQSVRAFSILPINNKTRARLPTSPCPQAWHSQCLWLCVHPPAQGKRHQSTHFKQNHVNAVNYKD
eukprot:1161947-Pelagomonas_calceolata.AAC.9